MGKRNRAPKRKWLSTAEVAELYGVHRRTVQNWIRAGVLPAVELPRSGDWRIAEDDADRVVRPVEPVELRDE